MTKKGGRPSKWDEIMDDSKLTLVEGWKRDGLSDKQVAENLGVSYTVLKEWKKKYPSFATAIKKGKEVSDYELENALHKRARGYYYTEQTITNAGEVVEITKYEHPNPTSLIFALKNRIPKKYRDKQEIEQTNKNIDITLGDYDGED
ncbi:helix-turn-helix domain-containing protein [Gracilibacillus saliphilus]|uniref:helix-turn-helix domain-containing protein n=1 Tax=Gracilibacillus saliphilus TaxID=543890 RepID=UPI0013D7BE79|nr:helix-turn-helix domain-containing protein [Gracilibacillus saliphilus]